MAKQNQQEVATRSSDGGQLQRGRPQRLLSPFEEVERFFDELLPIRMFQRPLLGRLRGSDLMMDTRVLNVDVIERDNEVVLRAEVPGARKEDLDIAVDENSVTIRGSSVYEEQEEEGDYFRSEIARGSFVRSITLPTAIDAEKAKASLEDGILELIMPKLEGAKRRKIQVQ